MAIDAGQRMAADRSISCCKYAYFAIVLVDVSLEATSDVATGWEIAINAVIGAAVSLFNFVMAVAAYRQLCDPASELSDVFT